MQNQQDTISISGLLKGEKCTYTIEANCGAPVFSVSAASAATND